MRSIGRARTERLPVLAAALARLGLACALTATPADAQPAHDPQLAKEHFRRGVELVDAGRFEEAAIAFERAYRASPHPRVLYNVGLAYAAVDDPVRALDALERYLAATSDPPGESRRTRAEQLVRQLASRIAVVSLNVVPSDAAVLVDGQPVAPRVRSALRLPGGKHTIRASRDGHEPLERELELVGGERTELTLALVPERDVSVLPGRLKVRCSLPGVSVLVDDVRSGTTPLDALLILPSGRRSISFRRPGYGFPEHKIVVAPHEVVTVDCRPRLKADADVASGWIVLRVEGDVRIRVDGVAESIRAKLPAGLHQVDVSRPGYFRWSRTVTVWPGQSTNLDVNLIPTAATRAALERRERDRVAWAAVAASAGIATGVAAVAHYRWNDGRHEDWEREQAALDRAWLAGPPFDEVAARQADNDGQLASIERADRVTVGLTVMAAAMVGTGLTLWLSGGRESVSVGSEGDGLLGVRAGGRW